MVFTGKPSRGCHACRKRKIKCDETRPACYACANTKRTCPGYPEEFDLVFRDQTTNVQQRSQRQKKATKRAEGDTKLPLSSLVPAPVHFVHRHVQTHVTQRDGFPPSLSESIPVSLVESPEQGALCFFFATYVLMPHNSESRRGYLDCLLPLYTTTKHDSLLSLATSAVALAITGNYPGKGTEKHLGEQMIGKVLGSVGKVLQDPVESKKDETLMAVLLLAMYERLSHTGKASDNVATHNAGALALIKHRGKGNVKTELSKKLLLAVQTDVIDNSVRASQSLQECSVDFASYLRDVELSAAARLTLLTAKLADLRAEAAMVFDSSNRTIEVERVYRLRDLAVNVDGSIASWPRTVPPEWKFSPGSGLSNLPGDLQISIVYGNRKDVYPDLWVANTWNSYRSARIMCLTILLQCDASLAMPASPSDLDALESVYLQSYGYPPLGMVPASPIFSSSPSVTRFSSIRANSSEAWSLITCLPPSSEPPTPKPAAEETSQQAHESYSAVQIIQELADDICASIPFHLGTKLSGMPGDATNVEYPTDGTSATTGDHRRAASALGGWFLFPALTAAKGATCLRNGQQRWISGQLKRIGKLYGTFWPNGEISKYKG